MRKNIFEIIDSDEITNEIHRIDELIHLQRISIPSGYIGYTQATIEQLVNEEFYSWKGRGTCISVFDMRRSLKIDDIVSGKLRNEFWVITYLEYAMNIIRLAAIVNHKTWKDLPIIVTACSNIGQIVEKQNLKPIEIEQERFILVCNDPIAIQVAEVIDEDVGKLILQYHHYLLKGNTKAKEKILFSMAKFFEENRSILKGTEFNSLTDNVGMALNNFDIRHSIKDKQTFMNDLSDYQKEEIYDEVYDMLILWFSALHYYNSTKKTIEELKNKYIMKK